MTIKYKNTSLYKNTKITENYLDLYNPAIIPNFDNTRTFTITPKYNKRPDLLAYDLYGDSSLWWIFVIYNMDTIRDPLFDFVNGISINVPNSISDIGI